LRIFQEGGDFTWCVSDCEELVGVVHWRWRGLFFVCDSIETLWCPRSPWSARGSIS